MSQPPELIPLKLKQQHLGGEAPYGRYVAYALVFIGFFIFFILVSNTYVLKYEEIQKREVEVAELRQKKEQLELENRVLARKIEELRTPAGQEKIARQQLKLIKPGESLVDWK